MKPTLRFAGPLLTAPIALILVACDGDDSSFDDAPSRGGTCNESAVQNAAVQNSEECVYFLDFSQLEETPSPRAKANIAQPRRIFLNRDGGTYIPGRNDAARNASSLLSEGVDFAPLAISERQWGQVLSCVQSKFARFDVEITDRDPGDVDHIEAVLAGHPCQLGLGDRVRGVAPLSPRCDVIERAVVYVFTDNISDLETLCEVTAHEIGHAMGLDHQYLCEDPMTYLRGCGQKSFQEQTAACGTHSTRECHCGSPTQNTVEHLYNHLGPHPYADFVPPQAALVFPNAQDAVPANGPIEIVAEAHDDTALATAKLVWRNRGTELIVDCSKPLANVTCERDGHRFRWRFNVTTGERELAIRAVDRAGNVTTTPFLRLILTEPSSVAAVPYETPPPPSL